MNPEFLRGVFTASTVAYGALAGFFAAAFAVRRRDQVYLLFAGVCLSLAMLTAVLASIYGERPLPNGLALHCVCAAAALASALNLHFVLRFLNHKWTRPVAYLTYAIGVCLELASWVGPVAFSGSLKIAHRYLFGFHVAQIVIEPGPGAWALAIYVAGAFWLGLGLLLQAYWNGRREALVPFVGALPLSLALLNDLALALGRGERISLVPHAFVFYALLTAMTLLVRARITALELESTISRLEQRSDELKQSHAELRSAQDELMQKRQLATVGELAAAIAHEVRNPLAVIVNAVAGLRRATLRDADRVTLLRIIEEETARLNRLVSDLLHFARPVNVRRTRVSLDELGVESRSLKDGHFQVQVENATEPPFDAIWVDPELLRRALDCLIENACQAMKDGGVVRIGFKPAELRGRPALHVEVADNGHGMDPEVMARAKDPFFTTRPSGTGLGLPIVQRIVEAHDGELSIASGQAGGTAVSLILPIEDAPEFGMGAISRLIETARAKG